MLLGHGLDTRVDLRPAGGRFGERPLGGGRTSAPGGLGDAASMPGIRDCCFIAWSNFRHTDFEHLPQRPVKPAPAGLRATLRESGPAPIS